MNKNNQTDRLHPYMQDRMQLKGLVILVSLTSEDGTQSKLKNVVSILDLHTVKNPQNQKTMF